MLGEIASGFWRQVVRDLWGPRVGQSQLLRRPWRHAPGELAPCPAGAWVGTCLEIAFGQIRVDRRSVFADCFAGVRTGYPASRAPRMASIAGRAPPSDP